MPELPAPLVPAGVDLRHYPCMSLDVKRLRDSRFAATVSGEGFRCGLLLWAAAWHQVPAGSLPDDDIELCALAGFGRAVAQWQEHRADALYGWVKCSDGRLHHPVVAEKAIEAWNTTILHRWKKETDRVRKENASRKERQLPPLEMPERPLEIRVDTPKPGGLQGIGRRQSSEYPEASGLNPEHSENPETLRSNPETPVRGNPENPETLRSNPETPETPVSEPIPMETEKSSGGNPAENALNGTERNGTEFFLSCPKPASPLRTRRRYPEAFERFWSAYPTDPNMSKAEAWKVWDRLSNEDHAAAIAAAPLFVAYCRDRPDYRPVHAERFLRTRRFDGFVPKQTDATDDAGQPLPTFKVRGHPVPEANIVEAVQSYRAGGPWHAPWGAPPDDPACAIPREILDRAGATQ